VEKLHHGRHSNRVVSPTSATDSVIRKYGQRWSDSFAPGSAQVISDEIDYLYVRTRLTLELFFNVGKFSGNQAKNATRGDSRLL
jgi:hypothetical protein